MEYIYNTKVQSFIENEQNLLDHFQELKGKDFFSPEFIGAVLTDLHPQGKAKTRAH